MPAETVKQKVSQFYNQVGWQPEGDELYQNALYEDLRPVSAEYIARSHARVARHLSKTGRYLLDAGSGPVQYNAYLQYSDGYQRRVCFDISFVALQEARKKLGDHGFFVVGDIAHLPFKKEVFDGIVALHTIHHLPADEKPDCYQGLYDCLMPGRSMVTVDGWSEHGLKNLWKRMINLAERRLQSRMAVVSSKPDTNPLCQTEKPSSPLKSARYQKPAKTFVAKNSSKWFSQTFTGKFPFKILTWRSVSVHFLRSVIQPEWGGKFWLKVLYRLEEWFPRFFGENGQYPLIVILKPAQKSTSDN